MSSRRHREERPGRDPKCEWPGCQGMKIRGGMAKYCVIHSRMRESQQWGKRPDSLSRASKRMLHEMGV